MVCAIACECSRTPFPSKSGFTRFAATNADRNLATLDGKGKLHGIGILVVTTLKEKHNSRIFRPSENLIENFGGDNRHENFGGDNRQRYSNNKTRTPIN